MRSHYWSCTKLADAIRGTHKPAYATSEDWKVWEDKASALHSFRYWVAETALDAIQDFIMWPIDKLYSIKYYIVNRWIDKSHMLTSNPKDIKPGEWCDLADRILLCMFNELVDFVEIETAHMYLVLSDESQKTPFWSKGWFYTRTWRSREFGEKSLTWQSELTYDSDYGIDPSDVRFGLPTPQAENAKTILELYRWWKDVYPHRIDPWELDSTDDFANLQTEYNNEDTEMLIKLIKARGSLWT